MTNQLHWVIFDSNIYRRLTRECEFNDIGAIAYQISLCERNKGIQATASPVVLLELVAHLLDEGIESKRCRHALACLAFHVRDHVEQERIHMIRSDEDLVCYELFNICNIKAEEIRLGFGRLACELSGSTDGQLNPAWNEFIISSKKAKEATEESWLNEFEAARIGIDPRAPNFLIESARASVQRLAGRAGINLTDAQLKGLSERFVNFFPVTAELGRLLHLSFPPGNTINGSKFVNSLWDLYLSYAFGPAHSINRLPILLVSEDKLFQRALKSAKATEIVKLFNWDGYKRFIGMPMKKYC